MARRPDIAKAILAIIAQSEMPLRAREIADRLRTAGHDMGKNEVTSLLSEAMKGEVVRSGDGTWHAVGQSPESVEVGWPPREEGPGEDGLGDAVPEDDDLDEHYSAEPAFLFPPDGTPPCEKCGSLMVLRRDPASTRDQVLACSECGLTRIFEEGTLGPFELAVGDFFAKTPIQVKTAIVETLKERPNHSCMRSDLPRRVLRTLGAQLRGRQRSDAIRRVNIARGQLQLAGVLLAYRATNPRFRLTPDFETKFTLHCRRQVRSGAGQEWPRQASGPSDSHGKPKALAKDSATSIGEELTPMPPLPPLPPLPPFPGSHEGRDAPPLDSLAWHEDSEPSLVAEESTDSRLFERLLEGAAVTPAFPASPTPVREPNGPNFYSTLSVNTLKELLRRVPGIEAEPGLGLVVFSISLGSSKVEGEAAIDASGTGIEMSCLLPYPEGCAEALLECCARIRSLSSIGLVRFGPSASVVVRRNVADPLSAAGVSSLHRFVRDVSELFRVASR